MSQIQQKLKAKKCLITAAAQGIGKATVERFIAEGAQVIAVDINEEGLKELGDIQTIVLDVTNQALINDLALQFQDIDILFNCAGVVPSGSILNCDDKSWQFAFDLNVNSMFYMIKAFLPTMLEKKAGSIINMSSLASSIKGVPNRFAYGTTKAAVIGLTKSVAIDYISQGVRCNAICPGTVDSPSLHDRLLETGDYEKALGEFIQRQPMGRLGKPEEIAALACYLASDESQFTTGQTYLIDGGWSV